MHSIYTLLVMLAGFQRFGHVVSSVQIFQFEAYEECKAKAIFNMLK